MILWASLVAQAVKNLPVNAGDSGSFPGLGSSPGEGNGNPLQYFAWRIPRTEKPGELCPWGRKTERQTLTFMI